MDEKKNNKSFFCAVNPYTVLQWNKNYYTGKTNYQVHNFAILCFLCNPVRDLGALGLVSNELSIISKFNNGKKIIMDLIILVYYMHNLYRNALFTYM